jgi:hypothetical protein
MTDTPETVVITAERLKQLEEAEMRLTNKNKRAVERLHKYNKEHPEKVAERVKRHVERDREAYNARRRELYRLKKEAKETADSPGCQPTAVLLAEK